MSDRVGFAYISNFTKGSELQLQAKCFQHTSNEWLELLPLLRYWCYLKNEITAKWKMRMSGGRMRRNAIWIQHIFIPMLWHTWYVLNAPFAVSYSFIMWGIVWKCPNFSDADEVSCLDSEVVWGDVPSDTFLWADLSPLAIKLWSDMAFFWRFLFKRNFRGDVVTGVDWGLAPPGEDPCDGELLADIDLSLSLPANESGS